jgi:GntR family transcriptional regulator
MAIGQAVLSRSERHSGVGDLVAGAFSRRPGARGPKYLALYDTLKELVENQTLRPGTQLPPDEDVARRLGLSLGTVQKAMAALRDDHLVERRHGAGTFVIDPAIDMHDVWHFRFLADDGKSLLPLKATALKRGLIRKRGPWREHIPGAESFVAVSRLMEVGGEFSFLSDFYFDGERFGDLASVPIKQFQRVVLRNLLTERYGVRTKSARQLLSCEPLADRECRILGVEPGSIGMIVETYGTDQNGSPIYYQRVVIPQNHRKLVVDHSE